MSDYSDDPDDYEGELENIVDEIQAELKSQYGEKWWELKDDLNKIITKMVAPRLKAHMGVEENECDDCDNGKGKLSEYILSFFDRNTGKFPKGETAVLTSIEKDFGESAIEPAKQFIESVKNTFYEYARQQGNPIEEHDDPSEYVQRWMDRGYMIDVKDRGRGKEFKVSGNGVNVTIVEPQTGAYYIQGSDEEFNSFDDAMKYLRKSNESLNESVRIRKLAGL
jgi:hypothetical protein